MMQNNTTPHKHLMHTAYHQITWFIVHTFKLLDSYVNLRNQNHVLPANHLIHMTHLQITLFTSYLIPRKHMIEMSCHQITWFVQYTKILRDAYAHFQICWFIRKSMKSHDSNVIPENHMIPTAYQKITWFKCHTSKSYDSKCKTIK